ncbi:hypothetical protein Q1695_014258 [Nippostrongylus brasiliensis]|nr:hypothetical protein Q1695_014258 [Nippostrongylus brasiliensis]
MVFKCLPLLFVSLAVFGIEELEEDELCDVESGSPCLIQNHEECQRQDGSDKIGLCKCIAGFSRAFHGAPCLPEIADQKLPNTSTASPVIVNTMNSTSAIKFSVDGPSTVQLPKETISAKVVLNSEDSSKADSFSYSWELLQGTGLAYASSYKRSVLELSQLKEGKMVFRVTVSNASHSGQEHYTLNILPKKAPNQPPRAVIRPESPVNGTEGTRLTLDAEGSVDDDKIVSYKWTQDKGPSIPLPAMNTPILTLDNMVAGSYVFSVQVTDSGGLSSTASVNVEIRAERDDPPKAHINECGSMENSGSITVRLPLAEINLCGNSSTDDKGIVAYNWYRVDKLSEKLSVDTAGTATSILTLKNVQANEKYGPYEFELHVKDTKGQTDSTRISIFVNKAENLPPTADAGGNHTVILPETSIVLDGNAKDDGSIVSYKWTQIAGPNNASFVNGDKAKATVSNLVEGLYHFVLTVTDDGGLNGTASAFIAVERSKNEPPVARASNVTVHLPRTIAVLNASLSTDDAGIVAFRWQPLDSVPASMVALDNSENSAVMFLTGLVKGVHFYNLTVADLQNEQDSVLVQLTVEEGEEEMESVEILMKKSIQEWTYRLRRKFRDRIEASLASSIEESDSVDVHFTRFESLPQDGRLRAVFWAKYHSKSAAGHETMKHKRSLASSGNVVNALRAVNILRKETSMMKEFQISSIQTLYCKLNCSGHGHCNDATKQCECDNFWMGNVFAFLINDFRTEDCAWSSVYFWLITATSVVILSMCYLARRRSFMWKSVSRRRFRRRKRYNPLRSESEDVEKEAYRLRNGPRLAPLPLPRSSDSLGSESDDLLPVSGSNHSLLATRTERSSEKSL